MKKKWIILFLMMLVCLSLAIPVHAASARLVDNAGYLTDSEKITLEAKLDEISARQGMDVVIVTVPALYGQDITAYADDFYDSNGYSPDGILLLISEYDREWAISTSGFGITAFTDADLDYLADQFIDALSDGEYDTAFHTYADHCDEFITQAKSGRPYDVSNLPKGPFPAVKFLLISLGVGLFSALIVTGSMKAKLKTVYSQPAASSYVKPGSLNITEAREIFLFRQLHRQKREISRSGGSSTHTSSSGRSHGGSRGSF